MIKNDNGMHLENYVENGVLCLELNLSDIMAVRCYTNDKELYTIELKFSSLDDMNQMLIIINSRKKALELYNYIIDKAENLLIYEKAI